ncbi:MAG TPA: hypothetical protein PLM16_00650 [Candidatus Woesebacteria bacterium]|nr:hypothetical protein [Candidatus Woesebacteria bacterium]
MTKKNNPFTEIARSLDIHPAAVFAALVLIVSLVGVYVTSQATLQSQSTLSRARTTYSTVGCNQACANNRYCEANHFCYQGKCRLASNPSGETCTPLSTKDASQDPSQKGYDPNLNSESEQTKSPDQSTAEAEPKSDVSIAENAPKPTPLSTNSLKVAFVLGLGLIGLMVILGISSLFSENKTVGTINNKVKTTDFSNLEKEKAKTKKLEIKKTETIK